MAMEFSMGMDAQQAVVRAGDDSENIDAVALKAYRRLADFWGLENDEAAALADTKERTWARMKKEDWKGELSQDQRLRVSALVGLYKGLHLYFSDQLADRWVKLPNDGPVFRGATPLHYMIDGGLPAILRSRHYIDALRGGL
jgi:hypothetical protein